MDAETIIKTINDTGLSRANARGTLDPVVRLVDIDDMGDLVIVNMFKAGKREAAWSIEVEIDTDPVVTVLFDHRASR